MDKQKKPSCLLHTDKSPKCLCVKVVESFTQDKQLVAKYKLKHLLSNLQSTLHPEKHTHTLTVTMQTERQLYEWKNFSLKMLISVVSFRQSAGLEMASVSLSNNYLSRLAAALTHVERQGESVGIRETVSEQSRASSRSAERKTKEEWREEEEEGPSSNESFMGVVTGHQSQASTPPPTHGTPPTPLLHPTPVKAQSHSK